MQASLSSQFTRSLPFKLFALLALVAILGLFSAALYAQTQQESPPKNAEEEAKPEPEPFRVVTVPSKAEWRSREILINGLTEASKRVNVRAETNGRIVARPMAKGEFVGAGQLLCQLEEGTRTAQISQAEAALSQSMFELDSSERLFKSGNVSEARLKINRAAVDAAKASLAGAMLDLERIEIRAPVGGLVEDPLPEIGDSLAIGQTCATLASTDPILIIGQISERHISKIKKGTRVSARVITGAEVSGKISYIASAADTRTRTFRIEVETSNPGNLIRDGLTTRLAIQLPEKEAHLLPRVALNLSDGGDLGVKIHEAGKVRFVPVSILAEEKTGLWVTGLPSAAAIIIIGQDYVVDGQEIGARMTSLEALVRAQR